MYIIQIIFIVFFPLVILKTVNSIKKLKFVSPILLCYIAGIVIGNIYVLPFDKSLSMTISELAVPLAIPLVLFSTNFFKWFHLAGKTVLSFCLVIVSAMGGAALAPLVFSGYTEEIWKISGMLVGVYTGGTPNLMAIGMGLEIKEETLILVNASDTIMGGIYLIFLYTAAKWILGKVLPAFKKTKDNSEKQEDGKNFWKAFMKMNISEKTGSIKDISLGFVLSAAFVGISAGLSMLVTDSINVAFVFLSVTSLGIAASFFKRIRNIRGTYRLGQYIILVFSLAIGTTVNIGEMLTSSPLVFCYTAFVMTTAIILHYIMAIIFRIDRDTTIITSTAGIYGPAFIAPVASAIKNREVIIPGLLSGLVGYAIGNYLGFLLAYLLMP